MNMVTLGVYMHAGAHIPTSIDCGYAPPPPLLGDVFEASFISQEGQNPKAGGFLRTFTQGVDVIGGVAS